MRPVTLGPPFLESAPPSWAARALAGGLLTLFAVGGLALFLVQVPETVVAPFALVPEHGADAVRTLHDGVITGVHVSDAQVVERDAVLFTIGSELAGDRAAEGTALASSLAGGQQRIENERTKHENQRRADEQEFERLRQHVEATRSAAALKERQLQTGREIAARQQRSHDEGLTSWVEASKAQLDADRLAVEFEAARAETVETEAVMKRLRFEMAARDASSREITRSVHEELERAQARKRMLDGETSRAGNALTITAPCAGTVTRLLATNVGMVVRGTEVLAEVACRGARLQAELRVPQRGLAHLRPGQLVKLRYQAFPYQRFGVRHATLRWISPMTSEPGSGSFRALATLDEQRRRGDDAALSTLAGMVGEAVIVVGRRTLASYAVEPLRTITETLSTERPAGDK
jgi:multidrug resistance efflux pump